MPLSSENQLFEVLGGSCSALFRYFLEVLIRETLWRATSWILDDFERFSDIWDSMSGHLGPLIGTRFQTIKT